MNIKTAAQAIRDYVSMDDILNIYGYRTRNGFMCCPFHGEKQPSLKVYRDTGGWHCYGCERGGSVIDFVMEHENCNFQTAVRAIDGALHLGLMDTHEDPGQARENERIQTALDEFVQAVDAYCDTLIRKIELEQKTNLSMVKLLEEKRDRMFQLMLKKCDETGRLMLKKCDETGQSGHEKCDYDDQILTAAEWAEILKWKDDDQYNEYRKAKIREFKEEVAAWRRRARRAA